MAAELLIDRRGPFLRAAMVEDGELTDLQVDADARPSLLGGLFLGRVERIVPGLDAAFVDIGRGRPGLLAAADIRLPGAGTRKEARGGNRRPVGSLLRGGQEVLVQVKAEPGGGKGPALTMEVSLPGRFLVMTPMAPGVAVSRRLGRGEERQRLVARVEAAAGPGGWIVRAGAVGAAPGLIEAEAEWLSLAWRAVEAAALGEGSPACLRPPPDAALRAVVEQGMRGLDAILVEDGPVHERLAAWCREAAPDLAPKLALHRGPEPLFERFDLDGEIAGLAGRIVPLKGGGSIVIDRTEAMTVVDVNGGERANPLATNLEAARQVARQLRLRNLGGIVVVDFIDMRGRGERERLLAELTDAVSGDPAAVEVYGMTRLGLVEMTRARRGPPVPDLLAHGAVDPN